MPIARPSNLEVPFASDGDKNAIPVAPSGALASYEGGFPPVTMQPVVAGGVPPQGKDFNGIFYDITAHTVWVNAGGQYQFDEDLSDAIGGYPAGMVLQNNAGTASYVSAVNDNTTDFNSTPGSIGTLWLPYSGVAFSNVSVATTGGSTTLSAIQAAASVITVTGALVSNATLVFPTALGEWEVVNNTTGPYTLTCKTAAGTGVTVTQTRAEKVLCDATNVRYSLTLGDVARETIGQGLEDDGSGNLRVKTADSSIRRTVSGVQVSHPVASVSTPQSPTTANNNTTYVALAATVFTMPLTSTLWNGFKISIYAKSGASTFTPNAADSVNGNAAGLSFSVVQGQSMDFETDGAGNWWPTSRTTPAGAYFPLYENAAVTVPAGNYLTDTSAGSFQIDLPAGPSVGDSCRFIDGPGTWGTYPLTIGRNGSTVMGIAENLVCNVPGRDLILWFNGSTWRLQ